MSRLPDFKRFMRIDRGAADVPRAIDDELRFHFDMTMRELMQRGFTPDDARREAERRFGDVAAHRAWLERFGHAHARRTRRIEWWGAFVQDTRYALRGLRLKPAFAAAVIATLALGVGANAAMFAVIDRLLFRPPAFLIAPERSGRVYVSSRARGNESATSRLGYKRFTDLRAATHSFDVMAPFFSIKLPVGSGDATRQMEVGASTADLWAMFDVRPVIGRVFSSAADVPPDGEKVIVLSYAFWQTMFGGRQDALGARLDVGPDRYTVIGVMPAGFNAFSQKPLVGIVPVAAVAAAMAPNGSWHRTYGAQWLQDVFVRRKQSVAAQAADADLTLALRQSWEAERAEGRRFMPLPPLDVAKPHAFAGPLLLERGPNESGEAKVATWLAGVAAIVLLIACANVANLLLARAFVRRREIAVRLALGVSRGRLLTQLMIESLMLAALGTGAGVFVARWGGAAVGSALLSGTEIPSALTDARVLLLCALLAVLTGLITGLAPAFHARRTNIAVALKAGARDGTARRSRVQLALLLLQAAFSVVLLVGAGLFLRSLANVKNVRMGYDADRLLWVDVDNRGVTLDSAQEVALRMELLAKAKTLPGVANAARAMNVPFFQVMYMPVSIDGMDSLSKLGRFDMQAATPEVFETMGTRILRGRGLTADDRNGAPRSMVVSAAMAKRIWPTEDPIGKCVHMGADTTPCFTVVGVAEDQHQTSFTEPALHFYVSADQYQSKFLFGGLFVRTEGSAGSQAERLRHELQRLMPGAAYVTVTPMSTIIGDRARSWKLGAVLFAAFGGLALLIAAVGLYSVIAYSVTQRMHEMGVRVALGARSDDLVRLIVGEGLRVVVPGIGLGVAIALVAGRRIAPLLFNVSPADPAIMLAVVATLLVVATTASWVPAIRAARADPNEALRTT